jgi:hypothetical protein
MLLLTTQALPQMREFRHPNLGRLLTPRHFPRLHETLEDGFAVAADNDCFANYSPEAIARMFNAITPPPSVLARLAEAWPTLNARFSLLTAAGEVPYAPLNGAPSLPRLHPNLLWVTVPDVLRCGCGAPEHCRKADQGPDCRPVGDADATLERFREWHSWVAHLPLAFVLQDGAERPGRVPWDAPGLTAVFLGGSDRWRLGPEAARLVRIARTRGLHAHMGRVNSAKRILHAKSMGCTSVDGTQWVCWRERYLREGLELCAQTQPVPLYWQTQLAL